MNKKQLDKYMKERTKPFIYKDKLYVPYSYIDTVYKDTDSLRSGIYELKELVESDLPR